MKIHENIEMSKFTSFKLGGPCKRMVIIESDYELSEELKRIEGSGENMLFLGNGSNTLCKDGGFNGVVIKLGEQYNYVKKLSENLVEVGAATLMSQVAKSVAAMGLAGFEFASGIPGSIGGAIYMNAGAYGGEMKDIVEEVCVMERSGEISIITAASMEFGYRTSVLQKSGAIVLWVKLRLKEGDEVLIREEMKTLLDARNSKQPVNYPSAGSFFKRPEGDYAGRLIDAAGMRGVSVGGAQVSEKHCGFIINTGQAKTSDVLALMKLVQNQVESQFGVKLEPEVRIVGEDLPQGGSND